MAHSFDRGGDRNYAALPQAEKDAIDFINWATSEGYRREAAGPRQDYAAHAARHLSKTTPDRFAKAIASWKTGRGNDVYTALVALADAAAAR